MKKVLVLSDRHAADHRRAELIRQPDPNYPELVFCRMGQEGSCRLVLQ